MLKGQGKPPMKRTRDVLRVLRMNRRRWIERHGKPGFTMEMAASFVPQPVNSPLYAPRLSSILIVQFMIFTAFSLGIKDYSIIQKKLSEQKGSG